MALVLAATGLSIYIFFKSEQERSMEQSLMARAGDVRTLVRQAGSGLADAGRSRLPEEDDSFAQVLDATGGVIDSSPLTPKVALLTRAELGEARRQTVFLRRDRLPLGVAQDDEELDEDEGEDEDEQSAFEERDEEASEGALLLATPVEAQDRRYVVVVGASLGDSKEALSNLAGLLLVGGPVALLLASLAGYGVAAAALRPVETMRRRAAAIGDDELDRRLPVADADDELGRLGTTLNAMLERLEVAFARERTFVSDASHELRTPLAILKTELELALREGRSPEELREALTSAASETDRLAQLAEDLLVIARFDRGRLPVRLEPLDVGELLSAVSARFERRSRDAGRRFEVHVPAAISVAADRLRIEQALGNVVDNALRHGGDEVELSAVAREGEVELRVADDGAGFPPAFLAHAFERFTRADEARGRGGSGLGLPIVEAIARAHGGTAHAANRPGGGAEVQIVLPASQRSGLRIGAA